MKKLDEGCDMVRRIWGCSPAEWYPISIKYLDGRWKDEFIHRDNLDTLEHEVGAYYAADLYFGCEGYRRGRRLKKYALPSSVAWFDNDRKDPRRLLKPTILVLTSPGKYQSYYFCDGPVPDEIRNGLNEYLEADSGGWMHSKVLRIPGTKNRKKEYDPTPTVKIIYDDGPVHKLKDLQKYAVDLAPDEHKMTGVGPPLGDALKIINKYLDKTMLPGLNATLLSTCEPPHGGVRGKRSDVVHKLGCLLVEAGASRGEVAAAIYASASFRSKWGRNLTRLWAEVDAALKKAKR